MTDVDAEFAKRNPKTALFHVLVSNGSKIAEGPETSSFYDGVRVDLGVLTGSAIHQAAGLGLRLKQVTADGDAVHARFEVVDDVE